MPCRNPCRLYIRLAFTYSVGPSSVVWSELQPAPPFPPMRVLEVYLVTGSQSHVWSALSLYIFLIRIHAFLHASSVPRLATPLVVKNLHNNAKTLKRHGCSHHWSDRRGWHAILFMFHVDADVEPVPQVKAWYRYSTLVHHLRYFSVTDSICKGPKLDV